MTRPLAFSVAGTAVRPTVEILGQIPVPTGEEPHRVALTPDDRFALVLNRKSGDLV